MIRRTALTVGAALLSAVVLTGCEAYDLPLPGSPVDADESFEVTAEFNDVLNLVPRSPVLVNDVTVGEVVSLERVGWHAGAVLRIQDDVVLPENTVAQIEQSSLLGEKYVALRPGPGDPVGRLEDGDSIPLAATGRNPELEEVLGSLSFLLNGGGVGQLKTITTELNAVFDGRQDRLRHVLGEMSTLVAGLDAQKDDIIAAMEALNGLTGTLNREKATVTEALDTLGPAVTVLADQHDQLISMLAALDRLGRVGTRVIGETKDQILEDLARLRPVLHEIAAAGDQLPTALSLLISFPFPIESNNIVYGDYANTSIFFNLNLQNLPTGLDALGLKASKGAASNGERTVGDVLSQMPGLPGLPGGDPEESAGDLASLMGGAE
ncbi:MAG TPA: MCE family protein [Nocardioidaceae bacterium]|nr:MCE family protein [Nocardioidaceae bacterium]